MLPTRYTLKRFSTWLEGATGLTVLQPDQGTYRPDLPYLGISTLPGSWDGGTPRVESRSALPVAWLLDFSAVDGTNPVASTVGPETILVAAGLSPTASRDAFRAALQATWIDADGWIVIADSGAEALTITTGSGWAPPAVTARQQIAVTVTSSEAAKTILTPKLSRYRVQAYGSTRPEADNAVEAIRAEYYDDPPPFLRNVTNPTSLAIRSGADLDARSFVDVEIANFGLRRKTAESLAGVDLVQALG